MQESMKLSRDEIIICYQEDVARLMKYLSCQWDCYIKYF